MTLSLSTVLATSSTLVALDTPQTLTPLTGLLYGPLRSPVKKKPEAWNIDCELQVSRERPLERCGECGNVVKLNYIGPLEDPHAREPLLRRALPLCHDSHLCPDDHGHGEDHGHHHPPHIEPKTFVDYVKPEYWYR